MIWQWFDCALLSIWIFRGSRIVSIFQQKSLRIHITNAALQYNTFDFYILTPQKQYFYSFYPPFAISEHHTPSLGTAALMVRVRIFKSAYHPKPANVSLMLPPCAQAMHENIILNFIMEKKTKKLGRSGRGKGQQPSLPSRGPVLQYSGSVCAHSTCCWSPQQQSPGQ